MKMKRILLKAFVLNFLLILVAGKIDAQSFVVSGTVTDAVSHEAMPGVNVSIKGTLTGTVTSIDGKYTLNISPNSILVFSFVGYESQEIKVTSLSQVDVALKEVVTAVDQVVVVGYGTQKKSDLTGAVTVVKTEDLAKIDQSDLTKVLQGEASGVQVHSSGEPGAAPVVNIRGIGSFTNGDPLYVIDGVPTIGIGDFSPSDIESMQILKDASSCAIYGARGANGVVIITTKRGKNGNLKITYDGSIGTQRIPKERYFNVTNTPQYQQMNNIARTNDGRSLAPANDSTSLDFISPTHNWANTDRQNAAFKAGSIVNQTLDFSEGNETNTFAVNLNYFDQTGTLVGPGPRYTRYSAKLNLEQTRGKFKVGESFYYSYSHRINLENTQWGNPIINVISCIPTIKLYDKNDPSGYGNESDTLQDVISPNEVAFNSIKQSYSNRNRFLGVIYGEYEFFKGLTYKINLSYDRTDWLNHEFLPSYVLGREANVIAYLDEQRGENPFMIMEHTLTFIHEYGKHAITVMGGYTSQYDYSNYIYGYAQGYTQPYLEVLSAGTSGQTTLGELYEHTMLSYLGRINYSYGDKYLFTGNFRRDASSNFGPDNKWGNFPSLALGWKVNNEDFLKDFTFISLLKVRAGWGLIGNEKIGNYLYQSAMNDNANAVFGTPSALAPGTTQINLYDPKIHWEQKESKNIGIDLVLFKNKLEFSAEYYNDNCTDLLLPLPIPWSTGSLTSPTTNAASMTNKGFEFTLSYKNTSGDFNYSISANLSTLNNLVTSLGNGGQPVTTWMSQTAIGHPMGEIYGWIMEGIFQNSNEINYAAPGSSAYSASKHAFQTTFTVPGDVKFKDLNGDGVIDDKDETYLGNAFPNVTGGMNFSIDYKGIIDLSVFLQGVSGNKIVNGEYLILNDYKETNYSIEAYNNYWRGPGSTNNYPRLTTLDANMNDRMSQRWVQDGSYLRIQNVQLGFNLPKGVINNLKVIQNFRIYITAQNLYTFTKYTGYDPDLYENIAPAVTTSAKGIVGGDGGYWYRANDPGSYPSPRSFIIGIKATF